VSEGSDAASAAPAATPALGAPHRRRLREVWRSAGWPCRDLIEVDLLAARCIERLREPSGHETLRVTDEGLRVLAETRERNRRAFSAHEALVERVAREMGRAGRIVWRGLTLRGRVDAPEGAKWQLAMPDVYSIRHTSVEDYAVPIVHEVKVSRADLLGDLRRQTKRQAYLSLAAECWYVVREGIARPEDVPPECGLLVATSSALDVARPAPRRAMRVPFGVWMALARATPVEGRRHEGQLLLGDEQAWGDEDDRAAGPPPDDGAAPPAGSAA